ncbi:ABC-type nitrate/sulfonate/bicarbonate transport system, substrate-binding protein [Gillisia sp. Hel1_33_143]|uniref:substrate-binding domain-containing protein n=1 Tax=Gillisia sp. Hel1_33_143 TaxID=1336796 RepID=UPI00087971A9|nr:substrate-binding domain-containing protein [Gillisia sp. Hel1_33_143]SDS57457.1 ABC-type nitrate/sulfonate/bicarbonate transport system, substrate-binding protein [Gillisia sp. Hel1_33_143]
MRTIRIGGVPEHFNLPWHLAMEEKDFEKEGLKIEWTDFPGGTGDLNTALRNKEIDVAVILTEGIIKDIIAGNPSKIVQTYVQSPLIWGIHVAEGSKYHSLKELEHSKVAISRNGSGSQLMAYVNAKNEGWNLSDLKFEIVGNIDGAVSALQDNTAQYFMWEHFTTKPLVDNGTFRRVADCPTPWPCFVIAVRNDILESNEIEIEKLINVINKKTVSFKNISNIERTLAKRYDQKIEDIEEWLQITEWSQTNLTEQEIENVQESLIDLKLISKKVDSSNIIYNL